MGLIASGSFTSDYFGSGQVLSGHLGVQSVHSGNMASGQLGAFQLRSGLFIGVSGIGITVNSSGQFQIGLGI